MKQSEFEEIAKEAARDYLNNDTHPNKAIEKLAEKHDLEKGHIERVAHYTNEEINDALMNKEAYVEFPVARSENISIEKTASDNDAFVPYIGQEKEASEGAPPREIREAYKKSGLKEVHEKMLKDDTSDSPNSAGAMIEHQNAAIEFGDHTGISIDDSVLQHGDSPEEIEKYLVKKYGGQDKQASNEEVLRERGLFSKIASQYGAKYVPSDDPKRDGKRMAKAAAIAMQNAFDELTNHATKLSAKREELYEEVKQSRKQGKTLKEIVDALKEEGHSDGVIMYITDRLEAEGLKETSVYDDDGPYSMQRMHRKAATLEEDSKLAECAREVDRLQKEATLDANCVQACAGVLLNTPDLVDAHGKEKEAVKKEATNWASTAIDKGFDLLKGTGNAAATGFEGIKDVGKGVGKWIRKDPGANVIGLGLGGLAAGEFAGRQEDQWKKTKTKTL